MRELGRHMKRYHKASIHIGKRTIRIGQRRWYRPRFYDGTAIGWHVRGQRITREGTFNQRAWTPERIENYYRKTWRAYAWYRLLNLALRRVVNLRVRKPADSSLLVSQFYVDGSR